MYQYNADMEASPSIRYRDAHGAERSIVIRLDDASPVPRFEQLRAQLSVMISVGRLAPGSQLPTVRALADQLGLAPGTVARTYRELKQSGAVLANGRAGTVVAEEPPQSEAVADKKRRIADAADRYVAELTELGESPEAIEAALASAIKRAHS